MNKYEMRTQKKKDAIIDAALTLFREKAYTTVSINQIASYSGVSSVSIYNYFDSKDGLVKVCANRLMQETIDTVETLLTKEISFKEKLLEAIMICSEKQQQLLGEYFSSEALKDKVFVELYNENTHLIKLNILRTFIELGKEEGVIDSSISTQTIMSYLNALADIKIDPGNTNDFYKLLLYGLIGH